MNTRSGHYSLVPEHALTTGMSSVRVVGCLRCVPGPRRKRLSPARAGRRLFRAPDPAAGSLNTLGRRTHTSPMPKKIDVIQRGATLKGGSLKNRSRQAPSLRILGRASSSVRRSCPRRRDGGPPAPPCVPAGSYRPRHRGASPAPLISLTRGRPGRRRAGPGRFRPTSVRMSGRRTAHRRPAFRSEGGPDAVRHVESSPTHRVAERQQSIPAGVPAASRDGNAHGG